MKRFVPNFLDKFPLEISEGDDHEHGALVYLTQDYGSLHFQHTLTTTQARRMADELLAMADFAEQQTEAA